MTSWIDLLLVWLAITAAVVVLILAVALVVKAIWDELHRNHEEDR